MRQTYEKGLHELGDGLFAYLQPDGSWGYSNAGLITDGDRSLLVDTLFDLRLTGEMLAAMRRAAPAARDIDTVVNTHANGDHCYGNQLVAGAEIIATRACAEEMRALPPKLVATLSRVARLTKKTGKPGKLLTALLGRLGLRKLGAVGEAAEFLVDIFGDFDFDGIRLCPPTRTFDGALTLTVGDTVVELTEVGPAHTRGDLLVHVPAARVVFTGDILFIGGHPIVWAGPVSSWIRACERILALDVETVVPGHGPLTDKQGARGVLEYLEFLTKAARVRYDAGMSVDEAARDLIHHERFTGLGEAERIVVNVDTLYREFAGDASPRDDVAMFARMAAIARHV
ncbi:MAG: MBL fold metallo-hydrolase [Nannocystaceae bacterium]|nr:MBL fold metallo-hydrolase [Myxococcales bacterium]